MFAGSGTHDGARPAVPTDKPYSPPPTVTFGSLNTKNQPHFAVGVTHGGMPAQGVDLALHHVVGWDIIWNFWNKLIRHEQYEHARKYLALFGAAQATTANLASLCAKNKFVAQSAWNQMMCWKQNNLVRGPADRSDDPNVNTTLVDKIDFKKVGKNAYHGQLVALRTLGEQMCEIIATPANSKLPDATLNKIMEGWKLIQAKPLMEWDEDLWMIDDSFPKYSNTPDPVNGGFVVVKPKWKIRSART
jgi:hypothetical protein